MQRLAQGKQHSRGNSPGDGGCKVADDGKRSQQERGYAGDDGCRALISLGPRFEPVVGGECRGEPEENKTDHKA